MELSDSYVKGYRRRQWTPLYDTVTLAAAGTLGPLTEFFGRTAAGSGIQVTNMVKANELPGVEAFEVHALRVFVIGVAADVEDMMDNLVVRFYVGRTVELEAPIEYFPGGAGYHFVTAASVDVFNGAPDPRAVAVLDDPIQIAGNDQFRVTLEGAVVTATARLRTRIYLDGAFDKGIK